MANQYNSINDSNPFAVWKFFTYFINKEFSLYIFKFKDPSIQNITNNATKQTIDDYNPFSQNNQNVFF